MDSVRKDGVCTEFPARMAGVRVMFVCLHACLHWLTQSQHEREGKSCVAHSRHSLDILQRALIQLRFGFQAFSGSSETAR